jgi:uncharacterized membrane protein
MSESELTQKAERSQAKQDNFRDCDRRATLQLSEFTIKAFVFILTPLICVGIWILLGLLMRWFAAPLSWSIS